MSGTSTEIEDKATHAAAVSMTPARSGARQCSVDTSKPTPLSDELAIARTCLANERTLLAWLRAALVMLISGITILKLFEGIVAMEVAGGALIPASALVADGVCAGTGEPVQRSRRR